MINGPLKNVYETRDTQSLSNTTSETTPIPLPPLKGDLARRKVLKIPYSGEDQKEFAKKNYGRNLPFFFKNIPLAPPPPFTNPEPSPPKMPQENKDFIALQQEIVIPPPPPDIIFTGKQKKKGTQKSTSSVLKQPCDGEKDGIHQNLMEKESDRIDLKNKKTTFEHEDDKVETAIPLKDTIFFSLKRFYQMFARYVVIDTEATGLGNGHKMTEIGCVVIDGMQITGEQFHSLLNPQRHVSPSAHKLTGYTLSFLSKFQTFDQIAPFFEKFVNNSPMVFHNAHFDLKLIKEGFKAAQIERDFEKTNPIFDTLTLARKNASTLKIERKNSLTLLCDYFKIKTTDRFKHGALIDALLTAHVFLKLFWEDQENFAKHTNWENLQKFNIFEKFSTASKTNGRTLFENFGVKSPLPDNFLYTHRLYHYQLNEHFPAIIIPFYNRHNKLVGFLVRYNIPPYILKSHQNYNNNVVLKHFYGQASTSYSTLFYTGEKILFIGSIIHGLLVCDALQDISLLEYLNIKEDGYAVRGVLTVHCFKTIEISPSTRQIFFLVDHFDKEIECQRQALSSVIERFCHKQFVSFYSVILSEKNIIEWQVKYMQENWIVTKDFTEEHKRFIEIRSELYKKSMIIFYDKEKKVFVDDREIVDPNTELLFSDPKITIRCVTLKTKETKLSCQYLMADVILKNTQEALRRSLELKNLKDLIFIGKIEQALRIYNESPTITNDSPVKKYCDARGIQFPLPADFRYREEDFHPWLEKNYPVLIVPLYNERNKIEGIHRIFFHQSGESLPKRSLDGEKIPTKLSLGKTVACANELCKRSVLKHKIPANNDQAEVVMLSEGFENGLIVRDALDYLTKNDYGFLEKIQAHFGITNTYSVKGCVGINGLIDVPLYEKTQTVVLLADNDGDNDDAKITIKKTIEKFLSLNKRVYLVFPEGNPGEKIDINDVFLREKKKPFHAIGKMLLRSIALKDVKELQESPETLQDIFFKLRGGSALVEKNQDIEISSTPSNSIKFSPLSKGSYHQKNDQDNLSHDISMVAQYLEKKRYKK